MSTEPKRNDYKKAIYTFGYYLVHRLINPWLLIPFIYKFTNVAKEVEASTKVLHDFSKKVIKERQETFNETEITDKRLSFIDILLKAKEKAIIDDDGIREEVDTFMFEVFDT